VQRTSDSGMEEAIGGNLGERPAQMKFGMAFDSKRLSGSKPVVTEGAVSSVLGWLAEIGQAAKHLLRLKHPGPAGNHPESVVAEAKSGHVASDNDDAEPTATKSSAAHTDSRCNRQPDKGRQCRPSYTRCTGNRSSSQPRKDTFQRFLE
jgi:hypothetical protein